MLEATSVVLLDVVVSAAWPAACPAAVALLGCGFGAAVEVRATAMWTARFMASLGAVGNTSVQGGLGHVTMQFLRVKMWITPACRSSAQVSLTYKAARPRSFRRPSGATG